MKYLLTLTAALTLSAQAQNAAPPTPDLSGVWSSAFGDITLQQQGGVVRGQYGKNNSKGLTGRFDAQTRQLIGHWLSGNGTSHRCKTQQYGTSYWGRVQWTFDTAGRQFQGTWGYCDQPMKLKWKGQWQAALPEPPKPKLPPQLQAQHDIMATKRDLLLTQIAITQVQACYAQADGDQDIINLCDQEFNARMAEIQPQNSAKQPPLQHKTWNAEVKAQTLAAQQAQSQAIALKITCIDKGAQADTLATCLAQNGEFTPPKVEKPATKPATTSLLQKYRRSLKKHLSDLQRAQICYRAAQDLHIANICGQTFFDAKVAIDAAVNTAIGLPSDSKPQAFTPYKHWDKQRQQHLLAEVDKWLNLSQWRIACIDEGASIFSIDACVEGKQRTHKGGKQ